MDAKTHRPSALPITSATVSDDRQEATWGSPPDDLKARISLTSSWIYSDIEILGNEVSSSVLHVLRREGENENEVVNHPVEALFLSPNEYFSRSFLLQYAVAWLCLDGNAYWYMAPAVNDKDTIVELWPMPSNRTWAVPDKDPDVFIKHYAYHHTDNTLYKIDKRYVVHFMLRNPWSLYSGLSKITAAFLPTQTDLAASGFQRDFYVKGRGIPQSVVSLSPEIGDPDFFATEQKLKEDFEGGRKIAVVRAGEFDVKSIGISQNDMQIVQSRKFTRDEIDSLILGIPFRNVEDSAGLKEANRMMVEKAVRPLHVLMEEQLTIQLLHRFYGNDLIARFEDVRMQDRAVAVQEFNAYANSWTLDEARRATGKPPYNHPSFPGMGSWLYAHAKDTSFAALFYGIGLDFGAVNLPGRADEIRRRMNAIIIQREQGNLLEEEPVPGLNEPGPKPRLKQPSVLGMDSPDRVATNATKAIDDDLKRWRKVALAELKAGRNAADYDFVSEEIPDDIYSMVRLTLRKLTEEQEIKTLFGELLR